MEKRSNPATSLTLTSLILITTIVNSVQQMIPPNLITISYYFGFAGETSQLGVLTFSFTLISGIFMIIFGYLADKIARKRIVVSGVLVYSFFSSLIYFVPGTTYGYLIFFILTSMNGAGFGAVIPSIFSLIGDLVKQDDRSKGFSFFSIANLFGMVLGIGLSTFLGPIDWRLPYIVIGFFGFVSAIMMMRFQEPSRLGADVIENLDDDAPEISYRIKREDLPLIFKKKSNIWLIINFVDTIPTGIIMFLLYTYMKVEHNIPESLTLVFLAFILLSTLIGTIIFGIIGDKWFKSGNKKARVQLALFANIAPIPFIFVALLIPFRLEDNANIANIFTNPGALTMLLLFVIGLFINGAVNGSWYATVVDLNLPEHRGTVLAVANFFDIIGKSLGPLIAGMVTDTYGLTMGMASSIIAWIFIPFFWISLWKNAVPEIEEVNMILNQRINVKKSE